MKASIVKGRTSKESHIAMAFQRDKEVRKRKYGLAPNGTYGAYLGEPYITDFVLTVCGYMLETSGRRIDKPYPSCSYCRGHYLNMKAIEDGGYISPEEYFGEQ